MVNKQAFLGGTVVKNPPANEGDTRNMDSIPGSGRFPWRRKWQPTSVFLPGESHGQRSLVGFCPWGHRVRPDYAHTYACTGRPAAAAAALLQSCPTLCDPIDSSPPGSPIPGILQARTQEWVAISFSNA